MNKVISGDYMNKKIVVVRDKPAISLGNSEYILLIPEYVVSHTENIQKGVRSKSNRLRRGVIGGMLFGKKGAMFGALTGNSGKLSSAKYQIFVTFTNNESSLLEIDKHMYKKITQSLA